MIPAIDISAVRYREVVWDLNIAQDLAEPITWIQKIYAIFRTW